MRYSTPPLGPWRTLDRRKCPHLWRFPGNCEKIVGWPDPGQSNVDRPQRLGLTRPLAPLFRGSRLIEPRQVDAPALFLFDQFQSGFEPFQPAH